MCIRDRNKYESTPSTQDTEPTSKSAAKNESPKANTAEENQSNESANSNSAENFHKNEPPNSLEEDLKNDSPSTPEEDTKNKFLLPTSCDEEKLAQFTDSTPTSQSTRELTSASPEELAILIRDAFKDLWPKL